MRDEHPDETHRRCAEMVTGTREHTLQRLATRLAELTRERQLAYGV